MLLENRYAPLTKEIVGCAMRVQTALGNGFPEIIYQRSLAVEFAHHGLPFEQELHLPVYYLNQEVGSRRVDFLVDKVVLVELKALTEITALHYAQVINYLKAYQLEVGLLLNFGEASLKYKRFLRSA
ncbi:GxxExxY protein [Hymenobacter metallilatus]|uniref:GxxExxY protein n=1 Tax=Hymenobacter metallilatus TaxID=2493666 RepID=A0A428JMI5_9BACT|nr:GxxExxY protein [Hymenobacter metallilatus]RSK34497.1 GxxExxY protein [Hymenobacter metallilatus]